MEVLVDRPTYGPSPQNSSSSPPVFLGTSESPPGCESSSQAIPCRVTTRCERCIGIRLAKCAPPASSNLWRDPTNIRHSSGGYSLPNLGFCLGHHFSVPVREGCGFIRSFRTALAHQVVRGLGASRQSTVYADAAVAQEFVSVYSLL